MVPLRFVPFFADADVDALAFFTKRLANAPIFLFVGMAQEYCDDGAENREESFCNRHGLYLAMYKYTANERAVSASSLGPPRVPKLCDVSLHFHHHLNVVNIGPIDILGHKVEELDWDWRHFHVGSTASC